MLIRNVAGFLLVFVATTMALAQPKEAAQEPKPLSAECLAKAKELLDKYGAIHDGNQKAGIPEVAGAELDKVIKLGERRGSLPKLSTITPTSSYRLIVLPALHESDATAPCPLHRTYIQFTQGGFNPQMPRVFGPLIGRDI